MGNSLAKAGTKASYNVIVRDVFNTGRVEDPIFCWRNFSNGLDNVETIGMCEGALKPALAYYFSRGKSSNSKPLCTMQIVIAQLEATK